MTGEPILRVERGCLAPPAPHPHRLHLFNRRIYLGIYLNDAEADAIEALIADAAEARTLRAAVERLREVCSKIVAPLEPRNPDPIGHSDDGEKLRNLADWFDLKDVERGVDADEVQQDLRRMADVLDANCINATKAPDPDAPHPLAYEVDRTDQDGEMVRTWRMMGEDVPLGDGWERTRLNDYAWFTGGGAEWSRVYLVRRVAPPEPQLDTYDRLMALARQGCCDERRKPCEYHEGYGCGIEATEAALAEDGES